MSSPTSLRLSAKTLKAVDEGARRKGLDRAAYLRFLIERGLCREKELELLQDYSLGRVSAGQICEELGLAPWDFSDLLKKAGLSRNVSFEDWFESARLE